MDCNMPIMDGYTACSEILAKCEQLNIVKPVIIGLTGHTEQTFIEKGLHAGMHQVISKPARFETIKQVISLHYNL